MIFTFPEIESGKLLISQNDDQLKKFIKTIKQSNHKFTNGSRLDYEKHQQLLEEIIFESTSLKSNFLFHQNYLHYLENCWANHLGIVITPDIIWYTILSEFAFIVKSLPETFRHIFANSTNKKTLIVKAGGNEMPLDKLVDLLKTEVPIDTSTFFPNFEFTKNSQFAFLATFCDICSPYYDYSMMLCGFPFIKVKGTIDDWKLLKDHWVNLKNIIKNADMTKLDKIAIWETNIDNTLNNILSNFDDKNFWEKIFSLKKCGSGHQTEASGWLTELFVDQPKLKYVKNYSSHISVVKYNNIDTQQHYEMTVGLFNSKQEDEFMEPNFSSIIYNMTNYLKEINKDQ